MSLAHLGAPVHRTWSWAPREQPEGRSCLRRPPSASLRPVRLSRDHLRVTLPEPATSVRAHRRRGAMGGRDIAVVGANADPPYLRASIAKPVPSSACLSQAPNGPPGTRDRDSRGATVPSPDKAMAFVPACCWPASAGWGSKRPPRLSLSLRKKGCLEGTQGGVLSLCRLREPRLAPTPHGAGSAAAGRLPTRLLRRLSSP